MPPKGFKCSKETRLKLRNSHLGKKDSFETKKKKSEARHGLKDSEITKRKKSETKLKDKNPMFGKVPWNKGKTLSSEQKAKISQTLTGKKHTLKTKIKMCESWKPNNKCGFSKKGIHNGICYDSSYELNFMKLLDEYKIPYERADNKNFRVKYIFNKGEHYYYPDFYLPREDLIVEIKASNKIGELFTKTKLEAAKYKYGKNFLVITEQELPELKG